MQPRAPVARPLQSQDVAALLPGLPAEFLANLIQNAPLLREAILEQLLGAPQVRPALPTQPQQQVPLPNAVAAAPMRGGRQNTHIIARQEVLWPGSVHGKSINASWRHELSPMDVMCKHCQALHWLEERLHSTGSNRAPLFGRCCWCSKLDLPKLQDPPEPLKTLLEADTMQARALRKISRGHNAAFQMASLGLCMDERFSGGERSLCSVLHACLEQNSFLFLYVDGCWCCSDQVSISVMHAQALEASECMALSTT